MAGRVTEGELQTQWKQLKEKHGGLKEDYFAPVYLAKEFGGTVEDYLGQVTFGNYDHGLDAFHLDRGSHNFYLYQFKWSTDHGLFKESLSRLVESGMDRAFGDPYGDKVENVFLANLRTELHEKQALVERVMIHFVFNGDPEKADQSSVLELLREKLESKKYLLNTYFGDTRTVDLTFEFRSNETRARSAQHVKKTHRYPIALSAPLKRSLATGESLHVGFARLMDLYRMHEAMGPRLFERNIRFGLEEGATANRSLRRALERILEGKEASGLFAFNHNGVTLSAERLEVDDARVMITEPRVLNGAQTITTVARFVQEKREHPAFRENRERLEELEVLAKVIDGAGDPFTVGVTIATNKQNPVEPWNLRSSERIQLELEDKLRDELRLFYERQKNAWESYRQSDLEEDEIVQGQRPIETRKLAQTFLAVQGEIDRMSRLVDVFEDDKLFRKTFSDSYLKAPAKQLVLIYKIQLRKRPLLNHLRDSRGQSFEFVQRGWNLVWALLAQAVFNQRDAAALAERFGQATSMEADYTERLKALLLSKVAPVIKKAAGESRFRAQIEKGTPAFLRTKAFYDTCMAIAENDYSWEKRSF